MDKLNLIQISDIHYPVESKKAFKDLKDGSLPESITTSIAPKPLQCVMREIKEQIDSGIDGLIICGDLTSQGDIQGYRDCISYLNNLLHISDINKWSEDSIHVVPGNHDINHGDCDPRGIDLFKKFEPLSLAWEEYNPKLITLKNYRKTEISNSNRCKATIFSLNSCIGCGEHRSLPEEISKELKKLFNDFANEHSLSETFSLVGEKLDTPLILENHIDEICRTIDKLDPKSASIVIAHHNLLPQIISRLSIYTEVINAGLVRSRFSNCNYPIIYCHGHIHSNPIEAIRNIENSSAFLLCISAPLISMGFNHISIEYSTKGYPIGCNVQLFRTKDDGSIRLDSNNRIPLQPRKKFVDLCHDDILSILEKIPYDYILFKKLFVNIQGFFPIINEDIFVDMLLECYWFDMLEIIAYNEPYDYWHIRRTR